MARVYTEGFEAGDLLNLWSTYNAARISAADSHTGAYCFEIYNSMGTGGSGTIAVPAVPESYARFWVRTSGSYDGTQAVLYVLGNLGGTVAEIRDAVSGSTYYLKAYVGATLVGQSAPGSVLLNNWHMIELRNDIHATAGVFQVRLDGVLVVDFAGNTKPTADTLIQYYVMSGLGPWALRKFDDIAINDTVGPTDFLWPGDGRVIALVPNAAGTYTDLTPSAGANWQCVDERPSDGDTSYVESSTVDQKDSYNLAACGLTDVVIRRVWVELRARKDAPDAGINVATLLRSLGVNYQGSDQALALAYARFASAVYAVHPGTGAAWTPAQLDALEVGEVVR